MTSTATKTIATTGQMPTTPDAWGRRRLCAYVRSHSYRPGSADTPHFAARNVAHEWARLPLVESLAPHHRGRRP
ncbi:hypothetical protein ACX6XY_15280 [Streptomyces sp. O3]